MPQTPFSFVMRTPGCNVLCQKFDFGQTARPKTLVLHWIVGRQAVKLCIFGLLPAQLSCLWADYATMLCLCSPGESPEALYLQGFYRLRIRREGHSLHYNGPMNSRPSQALFDAILARQQSLTPRIQHLPPVGSRPLAVAGRVAGWVTPRATACMADLPGVRVTDEAVHVVAAPRRGLTLDVLMARIALVLRDNGCLRGWRDELLDVYGEGRRLCVLERTAMRPLGLLTKAVHLNGWSPDGRIWLARRSDTKATDPGMWDTLVGGLAASGESLDLSLERECAEEAGLTPHDIRDRSPLRMVLRMHRRLPEGYQVEDMLVSDCVLDESVAPQNQDGEVSEIRLAAVDETWSMVEAGAFTYEAEACILDSLAARYKAGA